ncbi:MAG: DUF4034 domain-containing protein [Steroidobacteraceae bacterium]|jgi:hypothetical protein
MLAQCSRYVAVLAISIPLVGAAVPVVAAQSSVFGPGSPAAAAAESAEDADAADDSVRTFRVMVRGLLDQGRFADLDALADQLRSQRLRFTGGAWRLHVLYATLSTPGSETATDAEWRAQISMLVQWLQANPTSATAPVALAQTYVRFAWKARGHGYSDTVTPEGQALFIDRMESARSVLEASTTSRLCPQWYRQMQAVALAQGWDHARYAALSEQGFANEPGYYYFALAELNYLLPKWFGKPGEARAYAEQIADTVGDADGDAVYFSMAAATNCCVRTEVADLSWARIQRGFSIVEQRYGSTNRQRNVMAYLALRAADAQAAQRFFARISGDWNRSVWKTKALFDASRSGHAVGRTQPLQPDMAATISAGAID